MSKGKKHAEDAAEECAVCTETFSTKKRAVVCPFCPEEKTGTSACLECTQTYLLGSVQGPHCMACRHEWSSAFMANTFPKAFLTGKYRKSRQEKAVEREKGLLAEAVEHVRVNAKRDLLAEEVADLRKRISALKSQYKEKSRELLREERRIRQANAPGVENSDGESSSSDEETLRERRKRKEEVKAVEKVHYMFRCPAGDCRGLIERRGWKCGVCSTKVCSKCHLPLVLDTTVQGTETYKAHTCKVEDVETAKTIVAETKACPKCASRIYKIDGCDQMFCTSCHTPFSWKTGQVVTGTIHNPHYYELQKRLNGTVPRVVGDIPCGGLPHIQDVTRTMVELAGLGQKQLDKVRDVHRLLGEINNFMEGQNADKGTLDVRIDYVKGSIDERAFQRRLFIRERHNTYARETRQILETFRVSVIERLIGTRDRCAVVKSGKSARVAKAEIADQFIADATRILEFCNATIRENFGAMGYPSGPLLAYGRRFKSRVSLSDAKRSTAKTKVVASRDKSAAEGSGDEEGSVDTE
jgi:hypothetical protein